MATEYEMELLRGYCVGKGVNIGCGPRPIPNVINVDISSESKADVIADAAELPFPSNHFDFVVSSHCLEHIDRGPLLILIEWLRVLKIGGTLAFLVPNGNEGIVSMRGNLGTFQQGHHVHVFTIDSLQTLLDYAGGIDTCTRVIHRAEWKTTTILATTVKHKDTITIEPKSIRSKLMWIKSVRQTVTSKGLAKWITKGW